MRLGMAGPGPHLFLLTTTNSCHGFSWIGADKTKSFEICARISFRDLFSRSFHSILAGLHSFSTNHLAFRFVFAYASGEFRTQCCTELWRLPITT